MNPMAAVKYSDSELLDWLESQIVGYGEGVVVRQSNMGRGMRLHETDGSYPIRTKPQPTVREAIAHAMENENE